MGEVEDTDREEMTSSLYLLCPTVGHAWMVFALPLAHREKQKKLFGVRGISLCGVLNYYRISLGFDVKELLSWDKEWLGGCRLASGYIHSMVIANQSILWV